MLSAKTAKGVSPVPVYRDTSGTDLPAQVIRHRLIYNINVQNNSL